MWTGYRYYSPGQLQKLLFIIQLKDLGFTLSEIENLYDDDSHYPSANVIERKILDCEHQLERLRQRHAQLCGILSEQKKREYCEKVTQMGRDSDLIKFKELPEVPEAICMKAYGPYTRLREAYLEVFAEITNRGFEIAGDPRACYVDGIWNQEDPEKWLTIIQVPANITE